MGSAHYARFDETAKNVKLTLTAGFSQGLDGVKLFEGLYKIDTELLPRYASNQISIAFVKKKNWLDEVIAAVDLIEQLGAPAGKE